MLESLRLNKSHYENKEPYPDAMKPRTIFYSPLVGE